MSCVINYWRTNTDEHHHTAGRPSPDRHLDADPVHSSVGFEVQYLGVSTFSGAVSDFEATLADGLVSGSARIASLETKDENLNAHLLSPEFFDAERFPRSASPRAAVDGDGGRSSSRARSRSRASREPATLTGTITGPVTDPYGNERYGLQLETTIDRTASGSTGTPTMPDGSKALATRSP